MTDRINTRLFLDAYLGILSTFGPFVMDMYLSSLPEIAAFYGTTPAMAQMSLAACTVGLALGQLTWGVVSDSFGRRAPLVLSLTVFLAARVGCIVSPAIEWFIAMRLMQGVAAAGGVVISRSIAADCYEGAVGYIVGGIISPIVGTGDIRLTTALLFLAVSALSLLLSFVRG